MLPEFVLGLLFQRQADPVRSTEVALRTLAAQTRAFDEEAKKRALAEKKHFARKYEALSRALESFANSYNAGAGEVWPAKEAAALTKAIRDFENTATWRLSARKAVKPD
jgi:hypothetical protein